MTQCAICSRPLFRTSETAAELLCQCGHHLQIPQVTLLQTEIESLRKQLEVATEENAKLISAKYPFVHLRFDCSNAEKESAIRSKLIELGWIPPQGD